MNNILDKIRKRSHRRQGSSASQSSASIGGGGNFGDDSSSTHGLDITSEPKLWLPESLSFRTAPLVLCDDTSPAANNTMSSPIDDGGAGHSNKNTTIRDESFHQLPKKTQSFHCDLGESSLQPGNVLKQFSHRKSRFSNTLIDVLNDPSALGYFLTFIEIQGYKHLVKFWLETETFRVTASRLNNSSTTNGDLSSMKNGITFTASAEEKKKEALQQMTEQDAVAIFAKYIAKEAAQNIGATDELRNTVINGICDEDGRLDPDCFAPAQQFVLSILEHRFFGDYLNSVVHCKYVLELLNSGRVFITDILYNDAALFHFTEFMEQDGQRNLIEFWLSVDSFQQQLASNKNSCDIDQTQTDAMVLYDRYFSMQATSPLGFDDELRREIENNICREEGQGPATDCFEKPFRYILNLMQQKYLPRFMQSAWYARYLSELVNAAQYYDLDLPNPNRTRHKASTTTSTMSSGEHSTGSNDRLRHLRTGNTLLAQESPSMTARRKQVEALTESGGSDMAIETTTYDPNSLWKRDKTKVGFAHVDPVGRYVRDYSQATQHRRTKSGGEKISEAVKKFVHKDNKEKEALAEEVAALIIQDVTNMTCGVYDDDNSATGSLDVLS